MSLSPLIVSELRKHSHALSEISDYNYLIDSMKHAQIVLLGEATHGTREFYEIRAKISELLIKDHGFNAIAIEGDWPDAYRVNRFIQHQEFNDAHDALALFDHFPRWMWRNVTMLHFITWLKQHNRNLSMQHKVGFYGLDLYSLYRSIDAIVAYLEKMNPEAAEEARRYYGCFDHFQHDPQHYGFAVFKGMIKSCQQPAIEELTKLQQYLHKQYNEEAFYTLQNARIVKNAEHFYRSLFENPAENWNIRDSHMMETLNELIRYYQKQGITHPKIIVWGHNSHVGNAAATEMAQRGEFNIGELAKQQYGTNVYALGFSTYHGEVSAASVWNGPVKRKHVRPALPESYEALFHAVGKESFMLLLSQAHSLPAMLLERAIGVIYLPETERQSHYFHANIREQFDCIIHCDKTHALEPLEKTREWIEEEMPETYPSGF